MNSTDKRWGEGPAFRSAAEREIYDLQARLVSDPDERDAIHARIAELRATLSSSSAPIVRGSDILPKTRAWRDEVRAKGFPMTQAMLAEMKAKGLIK